MEERFTLSFGSFLIPYTISTRRDALRISISATRDKGIVVCLPESVPEAKAHAFVEEQGAWIYKHWRRQERIKKLHSDHFLPIDKRPEIFYLGKTYSLTVQLNHHGRAAAVFDGVSLRVECFDQREAERLLERWYRRQAKAVIEGALIKYSAMMGISYQGVVIKDQRTRWGSCSSQGNLNFSWRLIKAPLEVLHYVVVHELAHRKEMNHSQRFWELVGRYCQDYKRHAKWLKEHAVLLQA